MSAILFEQIFGEIIQIHEHRPKTSRPIRIMEGHESLTHDMDGGEIERVPVDRKRAFEDERTISLDRIYLVVRG